MSEKTKGKDEELILGVIKPQRFVQGMAMLPAVTLLAMELPGDWDWLAASFGVAGTLLIGIVVVRAILGARKLNPLFWVLFVAQLIALVIVLTQLDSFPL